MTTEVNGSLAEQKTWKATLAEIAESVRDLSISEDDKLLVIAAMMISMSVAKGDGIDPKTAAALRRYLKREATKVRDLILFDAVNIEAALGAPRTMEPASGAGAFEVVATRCG